MAKIASFKLVVEGKTSTLNDIDQIEKKINELKTAISDVKKISASDLLGSIIGDSGKLSRAVKETKKLIDEQSASLKKLGDSTEVQKLRKEFDQLKIKLSEAKKEIDSFKNQKLGTGIIPDIEKINVNIGDVLVRLKQATLATKDFGKGISDEFVNDLAKVELRLVQISSQVKAVKKTGDTSQSGSLTALIAEQKALLSVRKELNKELNSQSKINLVEFDSTSLVSLRAELAKVIKQYAQLSDTARESSKGVAIFNRAISLRTQVSQIEQSLGDFRRNVGNYQSALLGLGKTLDEIGSKNTRPVLNFVNSENIKRANVLRIEIDKLGKEFADLAIQEQKSEKGVAILNRMQREAKELNTVTAAIPKNFGNINTTFLNLSDVLTGGLIGGGVVATVTILIQGLKKVVEANAILSDLKADVQKTVGLTTDDVNRFTESLQKLDTRTSLEDLLKIGAIGGQQGIEGLSNITKFTAAIDKLKVSLGDEIPNVEDLVNGVSGLSNVLFGFTKDGDKITDNLLKIGNSLNLLSASGKATAPVIIDFASRIGGSLAPLGVLPEQILALSAAFQEFNIAPEKGATAINNLIKDLGANTELFAKTLKLNKEDLKNAFDSSPVEAFSLVLNRVNELSGGSNSKLLELLKGLKQNGEGVSNVFLQLGKNQDRLNELLQISATGLSYTLSLQKEFDVKNTNAAASLEKLGKGIKNLYIDSGIEKAIVVITKYLSALIPILTKVVSVIIATNFPILALENAKSSLNSEVEKGIDILQKETAALNLNFEILRDSTVSNETRAKAISSLVDKYPDLLNSYELEAGSLETLDALQRRVTATITESIREIVKARIQEQNVTLQTQKTLELVELQSRKFTFFDKAKSLVVGQEQVIRDGTARITKEIDNLRKQYENIDSVLDKTGIFTINQQDLQITLDEANQRVLNFINRMEATLESSNINTTQKQKIQKIIEQFSSINLNGNKTQEEINALTAELNKGVAAFDGIISGTQTLTKNTVNLDSSIKDTTKTLKDYSDELERLKQKTENLLSDSIVNVFDKEIAELRAKFTSEISELKKIRAEAEKDLKTATTPKQRTDLTNIIREVDSQFPLIQAKFLKSLNDVEVKRKEAVQKASDDIVKTLQEVEKLTTESLSIQLKLDIDSITNDLQNNLSDLEINFKIDKNTLVESFNNGLISQKEFNDKSIELEEKLVSDKIFLNSDYLLTITEQYDKLIDAQQDNAAISLRIAREELEIERQKTIEKIKQEGLQNGISDSVITQQVQVVNTSFDVQDSELVKKSNAELKKLLDERLITIEEYNRKIIELGLKDIEVATKDKSLFSRLIGGEGDELEKKKEQFKQFSEGILELTTELSSAYFTIQNNQADKEFTIRKDRLDRERAAQLSLAKGNIGLQERINREFDEKQKALEKEQFERRKKLAIKQALIDGGLAAARTLAVSFIDPFGINAAIQLAITIARTAAQVAIIRSQSFAKGEYFNKGGKGGSTGGSSAPPDATGERPIGVGVFHEDEFISTSRQTRQNRWLYDLLNQDRLATNIGKKSTISQDLENHYSKRLANRIQFIPQIFIPQRQTDTAVEISESSMELMINKMAQSISEKTGQAVYQGTMNGMSEAERKKERESRKQNRQAI